MKILVACECSGIVRNAFRKKGFDAYSCDIKGSEDNSPYHIIGDAIKEAYSGKYNVLIAHPPCTYLSKAGARWMYPKAGQIDLSRYEKAKEARSFFMKLLNAPIHYKCIENPTPLKIADLPIHSQAIQPYEFGHPYSKRTLLWLQNLPILKPTKIMENYKTFLPSNTGGAKRNQKTQRGAVYNATDASRTFQGIAEAMADQWGEAIDQDCQQWKHFEKKNYQQMEIIF